jgi:hypothetical protein
VTRFSAAATIAICWLLFGSAPARAQPDINSPRKTDDSVVCGGGVMNNGVCTCPAGFNLMQANGNVAGSGTCVRTNAENCLGGELTVTGTCFCNGRVTMSGETYALEFVGGKCVPKRCPEHSYLKDGKCVPASDRGFGFTCRTGYLPDEANPGTAATGLHCVPDPTFCAPGDKHRDGSCPKSSAIAIDCFEAKCMCGDPHADWVNYLCQCSAPYRNVNGACVSNVAEPRNRGPEEKTKPDQANEPSEEPERHRHGCGRGLIRSHGACVALRRRYPADVLVNPQQYYLGSPGYRFRQYPADPQRN